VPNEKDVIAAASVLPANRTQADKDLIASDPDRHSVKEALHASAQEQKTYGPKGDPKKR